MTASKFSHRQRRPRAGDLKDCSVVHPTFGPCIVQGRHGGPETPHRYQTELVDQPADDLTAEELLEALETTQTRPIRKGDRVRIVKPLSYLVSAIGVVGWVRSIDDDGWLEIRENGGTWYTIEPEKVERI